MTLLSSNRLRQVEDKAEHFARQAQKAEDERDKWEIKHEVRLEMTS